MVNEGMVGETGGWLVLRTGSWPLRKSQSQVEVAIGVSVGVRSHSAIEPVASQQSTPPPPPPCSPSVPASPSTASLKSKGRIKRDSCYLSPAQHRQPRPGQSGVGPKLLQSRHTLNASFPGLCQHLCLRLTPLAARSRVWDGDGDRRRRRRRRGRRRLRHGLALWP